MTATAPKQKRPKGSHRLRLPGVANSLSLLVLSTFVISRLFSLFPNAVAIVPFTILATGSLSYFNAALLRCHHFYWFGAANLLFTGFKYFVFALLVWSGDQEPFNDYVVWGQAIWIFLIFEGLNGCVFWWSVTQPTPLKVNRIITLLGAVIGGCAFIVIAVAGLINEPRRVELRYSSYDVVLNQQVEIYHVDYGGSFSSRGGIHCKELAVQPWGLFNHRSPLLRSSVRFRKHCRAVYSNTHFA